MEGTNGQVERASVALSRERQGSPRATDAGDACAVRVRTAPERARQKLARRDSHLEGDDGSGDHARKPPATSRACDRAASVHGGRPAGRSRNAAPRPRTCTSTMVSVIMAEERQVLLVDLRRPPRRAATAPVEAAFRPASIADGPSCASERASSLRCESRGQQSRRDRCTMRCAHADRAYKLWSTINTYEINSARQRKTQGAVLLRRHFTVKSRTLCSTRYIRAIPDPC